MDNSRAASMAMVGGGRSACVITREYNGIGEAV